jgi:hypothetical protein
MTHNFTTKSVKQLILLRGQLYKTIKWQPVLTEPCNNTIAQINSELNSRGIKNLK